MLPYPFLNSNCFSRAVFLIVIISVAWGTARAGDGTFTTADGVNGKFNFCVTVRFHATEAIPVTECPSKPTRFAGTGLIGD
jgi:hypothetical protein